MFLNGKVGTRGFPGHGLLRWKAVTQEGQSLSEAHVLGRLVGCCEAEAAPKEAKSPIAEGVSATPGETASFPIVSRPRPSLSYAWVMETTPC